MKALNVFTNAAIHFPSKQTQETIPLHFRGIVKADFEAMPDDLLRKRVNCPVCHTTLNLKTLIYDHVCGRRPGRPAEDPAARERRLMSLANAALTARLIDANYTPAATPLDQG